MPNKFTPLSVEYHQSSSYGPTIHIESYQIERLHGLLEIVWQLKEGKIEQFDIQSLEGIAITGFHSLILQAAGEKAQVYDSVVTKSETPEGTLFYWSQKSDGWYHTEGLLDGLIEGEGDGHQYLYENGMVIELYMTL